MGHVISNRQMTHCRIDHLVVTAPSLATGALYVRQTLGVEPEPGGEHPRMGTHNLLLRLGDALYLEVISPNPGAPAPTRPRWFALDRLQPDSAPALSTWVVRTRDIHASAAACPEPLGVVEEMSRGPLNWLITVPADGSVPLGGAAPALIEWRTDTHPAALLPARGLVLDHLEIFHPEPGRVSRLLAALDLEEPVSVTAVGQDAAPCLVAHIDTPQGFRTLSSAARRPPE